MLYLILFVCLIKIYLELAIHKILLNSKQAFLVSIILRKDQRLCESLNKIIKIQAKIFLTFMIALLKTQLKILKKRNCKTHFLMINKNHHHHRNKQNVAINLL